MDHAYIEEADLRARYVLHGLSTDEERAFEEHLIACPECQDAVETETALRDSLRAVSTSDARRATPTGASWASGNRAVPWLAVAASVLLAVSATLAVQVRRVAQQRDAAAAAAVEALRRQRDAEQSAAGLAARLGTSASPSSAAEHVSSSQVGTAAVFALTMTRGAPASGEDSAVNRISLGDARWIVLSIDLAGPAGSSRFFATLTDLRSRSVVWSGGPFEAGAPETLTLALDAALLHPGTFMLNLERRVADGRSTSEGRYPFHVVAPKR